MKEKSVLCRSKRVVSLVMATAVLSTLLTVNASAHSATRTDKVPQLNATIRSDAYIQTISDRDRSGVFQVTAAYHSASSAYARPKWIKTAWQFNPTGINAGVTVGKSSASVGGYGSTSPGGYWKNSNGATTAWYRGRVGTTGLCIYLGLSNTASGFKSGVPFSTQCSV